uniref:Uncharacterized protein n=1 Tax=Rhizophora mucronata TaxID=61149 RepID=A0A2P2PTA4_RHIMU
MILLLLLPLHVVIRSHQSENIRGQSLRTFKNLLPTNWKSPSLRLETRQSMGQVWLKLLGHRNHHHHRQCISVPPLQLLL